MTDHTVPEAIIQLDMPLSADEAELIRKAAPAIRAAELQRVDTIARKALAAIPDRDAILPNQDADLRTIVDNQLHEVATRLWSLTLPRATSQETPATPSEPATEPHSDAHRQRAELRQRIARVVGRGAATLADYELADAVLNIRDEELELLRDAWEIQRSMAKLRHKQALASQARADAAEAKLAEVRELVWDVDDGTTNAAVPGSSILAILDGDPCA